MTRSEKSTLSVRPTLALAYRLTTGNLRSAAMLAALLQCAVALLAVPLLAGLFTVATRAAGVSSVTTTDIARFVGSPLGVTIAVVSLVLTLLALLVQNGIYLVVAWQRQSEVTPTPRGVVRTLLPRLGALLRRPSTLLLIPYLLVIVPLAHVGAGSALTGWVTIPAFVVDELLKEPLHAVLYTAAMLLIWYVNLRLILTVPLLLLTDSGAAAALGRSWRMTRWRTPRIIALLVGVFVPLAVALLVVAAIALLPVLVSDALSPSSSPVVASIAFGLVQFAGFVLIGLFLLVQSHVLVRVGHDLGGIPPAPAPVAVAARPLPTRRTGRLTALACVVGSIAAVSVFSAHSFAHLNEFSDGATTVLAHRGFTAHGVENTIEALEAANEAGADMVEMDVQQTVDGGWVLMHDPDLKRLAGLDGSVGRLTTAEATAVTVHDEQGHSGAIPSLEEYLQRADELDQQLLIEIKVHGGESPEYVSELIDLIDRVDSADSHIYHSLSPDVVDAFAQLRPDLQIGYIVPLSYGGFPEESPADFFVVEQGVYDQSLRDEVWAHGRSLFVWTVEEPEDMRELFRDSVDGIISDRPDIAATELTAIVQEHGMTARLFDALRRLVAF